MFQTEKYYCFVHFNFQVLKEEIDKSKVFGLNNSMGFLL